MRNIRRDAMDHFKKVGKAEDISEDEIKDLEDGIQKLTDQYVAQIERLWMPSRMKFLQYKMFKGHKPVAMSLFHLQERGEQD